MRTKRIPILLMVVACTLVVWARPDWKTVDVDGTQRDYLVDLPSDLTKPCPLVVVFHGGGGNARQARNSSGFSRLTESGYILVYPNGIKGHWQVGMTDHPKYDATVDDSHFISLLLDKLESEYPVDVNRVYATGASNGGMMSHLVGITLSDRFAAIAPMIGGITSEMEKSFPPPNSMPVLIIQGTADPLVPYEGGPVTIGRKKWGRLLSTEQAAKLWAEHNGCDAPHTDTLPDTVEDECRVERTTWAGGKNGSEVVLYKVIGGGHTAPGGMQYLPESVIGIVCRDMDAVDVIESFFRRHQR
ncbi:MAG: esterase [Candidatus Eremiobacteraeota bacterium]|nr:esterase [Candidatus Eremiobacteraeota bacterium]